MRRFREKTQVIDGGDPMPIEELDVLRGLDMPITAFFTACDRLRATATPEARAELLQAIAVRFGQRA